jgi:hypothetical protein
MMRFPWRRWNTNLHRDVGYISVAMILIYGVSGLAVNHLSDWNPNYIQKKEIVSIQPVVSADKDSIIAQVMDRLGLQTRPENTFRPDPETIQLFYSGTTYSIDLPTGKVLIESNPKRFVLFEMNQLHLNASKGIWTYVADLFAIGLIFMGISGLFMLKGRFGITGRGKWFVLAGTAVPVFYWIWNQYLQ